MDPISLILNSPVIAAMAALVVFAICARTDRRLRPQFGRFFIYAAGGALTLLAVAWAGLALTINAGWAGGNPFEFVFFGAAGSALGIAVGTASWARTTRRL